MTNDSSNRTLQLFYAGLMLDAASNFEHFCVSQQVAEKNAQEQVLAAPSQLVQLEIRTPHDLFERFGVIFGYAAWTVNEGPEETTVAATDADLPGLRW